MSCTSSRDLRTSDLPSSSRPRRARHGAGNGGDEHCRPDTSRAISVLLRPCVGRCRVISPLRAARRRGSTNASYAEAESNPPSHLLEVLSHVAPRSEPRLLSAIM